MRTCVILAACGLLSASSPESLPKTNILLIVADDLGVDQLECYGLGADLPETPNIDGLADEGILFRNAWSNPVCSTTRATILTGRYSFRTGIGFVVDANWGLRLQELTIPEALDKQKSGYTSGAFGKWHLSNVTTGDISGPNLQGFSHYEGWVANVVPSAGNDYFNWPQITNGFSAASTGYITTRTAQDAVNWIQTAEEPWFCYVAFHAVHDPFHEPPVELYKSSVEGAGDPSVDPRPYFKAMVEAMDYEIGNLIEGVGNLSDTTIIFVGDNGTPTDVTVAPFLPSHAKATVYQGGIQVPLIVRSPILTRKGSETSALVSTVDLFPTVLELAGADSILEPGQTGSTPGGVGLPTTDTSVYAPKYLPELGVEIDGVSIVPYLVNPFRKSIRKYAYAEWFMPNGFDTPTEVRRAIRDKRYKYTFNDPPNPNPEGVGGTDRPDALYDLLLDPFELNNLLELPSLTAEQQQAYDRLLQELSEILNS